MRLIKRPKSSFCSSALYSEIFLAERLYHPSTGKLGFWGRASGEGPEGMGLIGG